MAGNRLKASIEGSNKKRSPLTSAGKQEETIEEVKNDDVIKEEIAIDNKQDEKKIEQKVEEIKETPKEEVKSKNEETVNVNASIAAKQEPTSPFGFVIEKRGEPDIKKQKMYNLKLGNIQKVKELANATGMSESALIDFLIENGSKVITIK